MSGSVVRSVSFPADDLSDVQDLADEHGGISKLFQYLYGALLDHRAETLTDPTKAELAAAVHEKKAAEEGRAEVLARIRREKAEERAAAARARDEVVKTARAKRAAPAAASVEKPAARKVPETFEEEVEDFVQNDLTVMQKRGAKPEEIERSARNVARNLGLDPDKFVRAVHALAGKSGQTNLRVLPAPRKEASR